MRKRLIGVGILIVIAALLGGCTWFGVESISPLASNQTRHIELIVSGGLTDSVIAELEGYGRITKRFDEIGGVAMDVKGSAVAELAALPYVDAVADQAERHALDYSNGISTWDQDIINVTDYGVGRVVDYDGEGVYVAVLDTGLVKNWRDYLPADQVATEYAKAFSGGGSTNANISEPANLWERDTNSHGTHVASSILGFSVYGFYTVNGAATKAMVIPVKVLGNSGSGWSTIVAEGILYIADLKESLGAPMVINMSLGGPYLSPLEQAAIDYAIDKGVIVVAAAGNSGDAGMDYPGAYAPVISVGAAGWTSEWAASGWWHGDVADPTAVGDVYVCDFSGREKPGQDLDVLAPGSWVVGPYLAYGAAHPPIWANGVPGQYYYLGGTSMATPHVAGLVALMLEKDGSLDAAVVEEILEETALPIPPGSALVAGETFSWGSNATGSGLVQADAALGAL